MIPAFAPQLSKRETLQDILCNLNPEPSTMMTIPYIDPTVELTHVLENVLALQPNSALEMAIRQNGLTSIHDVLTNDDAAIAALMYMDGFIKVEDKVRRNQR